MKNSAVLSFIMVMLLSFLMLWSFKSCGNGKENNFSELNYSRTGNTVLYSSVSKNEEKTVTGETPLVKFAFDTKGAVLSSYIVKSKHPDEKGDAQLVLQNQAKKPFAVFWGNDRRNPISDVFKFTDLSTEKEIIYLFQCDFKDDYGKIFTMNKEFTLLRDSFLFKVAISFSSEEKEMPIFGNQGYAYSLYYGPQLGPEYKKLSKKTALYDEERLIHENFVNKKGKEKTALFMRSNLIKETQKEGDIYFFRRTLLENHYNWVALSGKYFLFVADIPNQNKFDLFYASDSVPIKKENSFNMIYENEFFLTQKIFKDNNQEKKYDLQEKSNFYFYMGPRSSKFLKIAENSFGRKDLKLNSLARKGFLGLNIIVEKIISFINFGIKGHGVGNWGLSIVFFTLLLKIALFSFNKKSLESSSKMQELAPKMTEIRDRYKDKPQELNAAMAQFYKKEKINPMMGCLPMIVQFPILIAVYTFINNSYELRGAPFFGWIQDLSSQDALIPFSFTVPWLNWTSFNLLPVLYIATQYLSTILMTTKPKKKKGKENKKEKLPMDNQQMQMKFMQYGMPFIFFFMLYNAPSGLFVYWIVMNLFTLVQQLLYRKTRKEEAGEVSVTDKKIKKA